MRWWSRRTSAPRALSFRTIASSLLALITLAAVIPTGAASRPLVWARAAEAPTLDPHALDEGVALTLNLQIYEPLLLRDYQGKTTAALAESWAITADPAVWEFRIRQGVTFHDGAVLTADDVVFSINRARQDASQMSTLLSAIEQVIRVDAQTILIRTRSPTPLLPANLTHVLIMNKAWTEKLAMANVLLASDRSKAQSFRQANGTGPFVLVSREPGVRTVLRRNDAYWDIGRAPIEIAELVYRPIPNDTERVQALLAGEVDFLQDVPVNELPRLQATKSLTVALGPENRSIFLGLNVGDAELASSDVKGRNPLADKRVREAISMAINRQTIQRAVMLGQSIPTGSIVPPSVNGYQRQLDRIPAPDPVKAKALLAEADYPNGFSLKLDCPGNVYVRDAAICRAVVTQLAQVGITVELVVRDRAEHQAVLRREPPGSDFFLLGWTAPTFDSEQLFDRLYHSRSDQRGALNATRYTRAEIDSLMERLRIQTDLIARNQTIAQIAKAVHEDTPYVPLHIQTVTYAMKAEVNIDVDIENQPKLKFTRFRQPPQ